MYKALIFYTGVEYRLSQLQSCWLLIRTGAILLPIYQSAHYQVNESAVPKVKAAIEEFIHLSLIHI